MKQDSHRSINGKNQNHKLVIRSTKQRFEKGGSRDFSILYFRGAGLCSIGGISFWYLLLHLLIETERNHFSQRLSQISAAFKIVKIFFVDIAEWK